METEGALHPPTPDQAADQLARVADTRRRMQADPSRRALALYAAWSSVAFAAFLLVFLLAWPPSDGFFSPGLALMPLLLFTALAQGAVAGRGARFRPGRTEWLIMAAAITIVFPSMALGLLIDLPLYARIGLPLLVLVVQGAPALAVLRRTASATAAEPRAPLTAGARVTTTAIALLAAATIIASPWPVVSGIAALVAFLLLLVASWAEGLPWGLAPTGAQWGAWQWGAFAVVAALQSVTLLLTVHTVWFGVAASLPMGVAAAIVMTVAAWRPGAAGRSVR
ncbi:hypothetical protein NQ156_03295 [Microbacterium sp. zg.Y625]|uniref:hypothetical protein n=1 Tax=Microbacterium jiangjiandongii TaxID=3049071 RepID=UPI00214CB8D1|nr:MULTISPECIES: hypothetical protein [unclassified Microbacterium]MCR2792082.1 hypothetical protein [Microbacterium sp. zg.Y625]WIM24888.1 hypothetical protein QNO14_12205 [Microbacterium sp. zg-Y625]